MQRKILQLTFSAKVATSANNGIILMLNVSVKSSPVGKRLETQSNEAKLSELPACTQIKRYRKKSFVYRSAQIFGFHRAVVFGLGLLNYKLSGSELT